MARADEHGLPDIGEADTFDVLAAKLSAYVVLWLSEPSSRTDTIRCLLKLIEKPMTFENLRTSQSHVITPLVRYLTADVHNPALVAALMFVPSST